MKQQQGGNVQVSGVESLTAKAQHNKGLRYRRVRVPLSGTGDSMHRGVKVCQSQMLGLEM